MAWEGLSQHHTFCAFKDYFYSVVPLLPPPPPLPIMLVGGGCAEIRSAERKQIRAELPTFPLWLKLSLQATEFNISKKGRYC